MTLPVDFQLSHALAIGFVFALWFAYTPVLRIAARGSLNEQLSVVRAQWLMASVSRAQKPFDAILLGHMVNSIAFFGSATMLVLAAMATLFANARSGYAALASLYSTSPPSFELFAVQILVLTVALAISFFSFTYALRKLIYVLALVGGLPETPGYQAEHAQRDIMVHEASVVLSEALKTFNFGIRGYYYFVSALALFVSPYLCISMTIFMTGILVHRQLGSTTARAIRAYVDASERYNASSGPRT